MLICAYFHQALNPLLQVYPFSRDHVRLDQKLLILTRSGPTAGLPTRDVQVVYYTIPESTIHIGN